MKILANKFCNSLLNLRKFWTISRDKVELIGTLDVALTNYALDKMFILLKLPINIKINMLRLHDDFKYLILVLYFAHFTLQ